MSTVNSAGEPTVSYKGGDIGHVTVTADQGKAEAEGGTVTEEGYTEALLAGES